MPIHHAVFNFFDNVPHIEKTQEKYDIMTGHKTNTVYFLLSSIFKRTFQTGL